MTPEKLEAMFSAFLQKGDVKTAKQLLAFCGDTANLDRLDGDGNSLLHLSCTKGNTEAVRLLVREGASLDLKNFQGRTALHLSSAKSHSTLTKYLVEHGADVMVYDNEGELPLDVAGCLETALILVKKMVALGYNDLINDYLVPINFSKNKIDEIEPSSSLIKSLKDQQKSSPEDLAVNEALENQQGCRFRLEGEEDTEQKQDNKRVADSDENSIFPQQTRRYTFPSYLGFMRPSGSILKRSMSFSGNQEAEETPEEPADQNGKGDRKSGNRSVTFPSDILCQVCIMDNDYKDLKRLILCDKIQELNKLYANGITALHLSAIENKYKCAEVLIDCGADIEMTDPHGWTPLHAAAFAGNIKCVKALCNKGANICATTNNGETVFDLAVTDLIRKYLKMMTIRLVMDEKRHLQRMDSV